MPHYIVESIEFDFSDSMGTIPEEALIEKITEKTGWCIKSIKFCENRPHPLTGYK